MKFRRRSNQVDAIQYVETSRRPATFADIVERNEDEIAVFVGVRAWRVMTIPNGMPEGRAVMVMRAPELPHPTTAERISVEIGEWVVRSALGEIVVYTAETFAELFEPI